MLSTLCNNYTSGNVRQQIEAVQSQVLDTEDLIEDLNENVQEELETMEERMPLLLWL